MSKSNKKYLILISMVMFFVTSLFSYTDKDNVLKYLDNGINNYYLKNYSQAIDDLLKAENEIYSNYTKSITSEIGSFIVNDTVKDYPGEIYEDLYINIFKSLCYYNLGLIDDAIVEVNRFNNKIKGISQKYQSEIEKTKQILNNEGIIENSINFHNSALGEYLTMLYYKAIGDSSTAYTAKRRIDDAFTLEREIYNFKKPSTIEADVANKKGTTRLNVIAFSGLPPKKVEEKKVYSDQFILSVPSLEREKNNINIIKVEARNIDTGKSYYFSLEKIEELSNIAFETFITKSDICYYKALARALAKGGTTTGTKVAGDILSDSDNFIASLAGNILSSASIMNENYTQMSEKADLRYCKKLPSSTFVGGVDVESGSYNIYVSYYADLSSAPIYTQYIYNKNLLSGKLNIIDSSSVNKEIEIKEKESKKYSAKNYSTLDSNEGKFKFDLGVEPGLDGSRVYGMVGYNWTDEISSTLNLSYSSMSEKYDKLDGAENVIGIKKNRSFESVLNPFDYNLYLVPSVKAGVSAGLAYQYIYDTDNVGMFSKVLEEDKDISYIGVDLKQTGHIVSPVLGGYINYIHDYFDAQYNLNINPFYSLSMKSDMSYKYQLHPDYNVSGGFNINKWSSPFIEQNIFVDALSMVRLMINHKYQRLNVQQLDLNEAATALIGYDDVQNINTLRFGIELLGGKKGNTKIKGGFYYEVGWTQSSYLKECGKEDIVKESKWGFTIGTGN